MAKKITAPEFDVTKHVLVPKHAKLSEKERKDVLAQYSIEARELPKILLSDPAIHHLAVVEGDIIKVIRPSMHKGMAVFYRRVTSV